VFDFGNAGEIHDRLYGVAGFIGFEINRWPVFSKLKVLAIMRDSNTGTSELFRQLVAQVLRGH